MTETIVVNNTNTNLNVNMANVTKLTASNFLMWSRQIHALLDGYDLAGHIDESTQPPPAMITTENGDETNPAYTLWKRQDRLIYSALLGAISVTLQPILSTATTSAQIWSTLHLTYAKPSRGHIQQIKQQLKSWTKGTKTINEYYQGLTTRFDELALFGKPYDHEDQVEQILTGLPEDYKNLVDQIEGRDVAPSLTELHEKLINFEAKLQAATPVISTVPVTANFSNYRGNSSNNNNRGNHNSKRGGYRGQQNWQQQQQFGPTSNSNTSRRYQGKCQLCGVFGHSARRCTQLSSMGHAQPNVMQQPQASPWQPQANVGTFTQYNPQQWLLDSGATHHLTSDLNNLALHQPYNGGEEVAIADGSGLPITHTGSASISTPTRSLLLNDVLCVPHVNKNLLYVYRLCNANQVCVAFYRSYFQVMDLNSGDRLLQGHARNELYEWPVSPILNPASYATYPDTKATLAQWHTRLGHPSLSTLKSVVSKFSLPCSNTSSFVPPCNDYLLNKIHKLPFHQRSIKSSQPLQYIFSDVWQSPVLSSQNYKYYLVLVDHFTRYCWMYPLKAKSEVKNHFIAFKSLVETRFQTKIQTLYSDNGGGISCSPRFSFCQWHIPLNHTSSYTRA